MERKEEVGVEKRENERIRKKETVRKREKMRERKKVRIYQTENGRKLVMKERGKRAEKRKREEEKNLAV